MVTEETKELLDSKNKDTGKGQSRFFFSKDSDKFVPRSFGFFAEDRKGIRAIDIEHPIDGKMVKISQTVYISEGIQEFYTDGKLVDKRKLDNNGYIISENLVENEEINK